MGGDRVCHGQRSIHGRVRPRTKRLATRRNETNAKTRQTDACCQTAMHGIRTRRFIRYDPGRRYTFPERFNVVRPGENADSFEEQTVGRQHDGFR
jgi:hypothetical protein